MRNEEWRNPGEVEPSWKERCRPEDANQAEHIVECTLLVQKPKENYLTMCVSVFFFNGWLYCLKIVVVKNNFVVIINLK